MWEIDESPHKPSNSEKCDWHIWLVDDSTKPYARYMFIQLADQGAGIDEANFIVQRILDGLNKR